MVKSTSIAQHRGRVHSAKRRLLYILIICLLLIVGYVILSQHHRIVLNAKSAVTEHFLQEVLKPHLRSMDLKRQFFDITAQSAVHVDDNHVILTNPYAIMTLLSGEKVEVTALSGTYNNSDDTLYLSGNVVLITSDGNSAFTHSATVFLKTHRIVGQEKLQLFTPQDVLQSDGFELMHDHKHIILTGHVIGLIAPSNRQALRIITPPAPSRP